MDILETSASGISGGILGTIFAWLGLSRRFETIEKRQDLFEANLQKTKDEVVFKDTCAVCSTATCQRMTDISNKLDYLIKRIDETQLN